MASEKTHITERSAVAVVMTWMREIIERHNLDLGLPHVETSGKDNKFPDMEIYSSRRSQDVLCSFEAKRPDFDVFENEELLKEPARRKAVKRKAPYFALLNFRKLVWFDTAKVNQSLDDEQQIVQTYTLSDLKTLDELETTRNRERIKHNLEEFLLKLYAVHNGKEAVPQIPVDELLINRLQEKIALLTHYYSTIVEEKYLADSDFGHRLSLWFFDQNWNFEGGPDDFLKAARQASYLLVIKILFYDTLQTKRPADLDVLEIPQGLTKGTMLQKHLQGYFDMALLIDYESVFTSDFVDELAFPDSREVIEEIKKLVLLLNRYDLAELGFDIIGRIFERLIPAEERHNFGQYFTSSDVVDLILKFCLKHESDKTLDPSCGSGTFLVRAYQHKKMMNRKLSHEEILETLWGNDIAKFPASLSIINLAINDLSVDQNYPNILREDFFNIQVGGDGIDLEAWRKRTAQTLSGKERELTYPKQFDVIVGNPPYTRQEEIPGLAPEDLEYKENLIEGALKVGGQKIANIGKRAGIHAFFFVHGWKFLKDGGRFGFIVSNSWLDTDYGRGLQEFFLENYKIVAIIESKVERWFVEADVNTCIVILEKCSDKRKRDENVTRFVYLQKPLRSFIPPTSDKKEEEKKRQHAVEDFCDTILTHRKVYQNEELRIFPRRQDELTAEGFDQETEKFVGAKWGKYLRAPDIFFHLLQKCEGKLAYLRELAHVETYLNTGGADGFFIVKQRTEPVEGQIKIFSSISDKKEKVKITRTSEIEEKFAQPFIKSPRELSTISINDVDATWLLILPPLNRKALKDTHIGKYVRWGEKVGINLRSGCLNRDPWWSLPKQAQKPGPILWSRIHNDAHIVYYNPRLIANTNFYTLWSNDIDPRVLATVLNSTYLALVQEFSGRVNFGQGALKTEGSDIKGFLVPKAKLIKSNEKSILKVFKKISNRQIGSIFEELGSDSLEEVAFENVKPDRLELDKIVIRDILGLSEAEHLEIYRAVVDLVRSRLDKAKSVGKNDGNNDNGLEGALRSTLNGDFWYEEENRTED